MKTKNIFKTLALAMLMPAMLLTTACSNDDDIAGSENTENIIKKGYTIPVTINVTRQGDATTRATYTDNGNKTGNLAFSEGDKLFVSGLDADDGSGGDGGEPTDGRAGQFTGTLEYVEGSGGTFSGTITIENPYTGTIDDLFTAGDALAYLLPAGYESYNYLSVTENNGYDAEISFDLSKAFTTSKVTAVEQFSYEQGFYANGSFALVPGNAILNFTITDLAASTPVAVEFIEGYYGKTISGSVTPNDGTASFAIGVFGYTDLDECVLTVGDIVVTLVGSSKYVEDGKIYNINRKNPLYVPLTLVAKSDNSEITVSNPKDGMQYTVNGGAKTAVTSSAISVNKGDKVAFYGNGTSITVYGGYGGTKISCSKDYKVYGNIMSLVNETGFASATSLGESAFSGLFSQSTYLTDASGLILPATTLARSCYESMFKQCTSLRTAPVLPATTLVKYCYENMFYNCSSLRSVTCLATDISASSCTYYWLYGVDSDGTFTKAAGVDWSGKSGSDGIPSGWDVKEK